MPQFEVRCQSLQMAHLIKLMILYKVSDLTYLSYSHNHGHILTVHSRCTMINEDEVRSDLEERMKEVIVNEESRRIDSDLIRSIRAVLRTTVLNIDRSQICNMYCDNIDKVLMEKMMVNMLDTISVVLISTSSTVDSSLKKISL